MNKLYEIQSTVARHRLTDGSYADVRIDGADVAVLLAVAKGAFAYAIQDETCPVCRAWVPNAGFNHDDDCALGALLKEV